MTNHQIRHFFIDVSGVIILNKKVDFRSLDKRLGLKEGTAKRFVYDCVARTRKDPKFDLKAYIAEAYKDVISPEAFQKILGQIHNSEYPNFELIKWVASLKKKNPDILISILSSNTKPLGKLLRNKIKGKDLPVDHTFVAKEIGYIKSDKRYFEYILKVLKTKPADCLFVDDKKENIQKAEKLGLNGVQFVSNHKLFKDIKKYGLL